MTAVIREAEERRKASSRIRSSIMWSLTGEHVGWTTRTSRWRLQRPVPYQFGDAPNVKATKRITPVSRFARNDSAARRAELRPRGRESRAGRGITRRPAEVPDRAWKKMEERPARQLPNLLFGRRLLLLDQLDAEFPAALDEENALRRGVARRRVSAVCRLEQVRAGSQPRLGLPFLPVDPSARDDHDLVIGRMRVERRGETGRELLDGAVGALGRIAPELGECRSGWRTGQRLELEISRRPRDKSLCARLLGRLGLAGLG